MKGFARSIADVAAEVLLRARNAVPEDRELAIKDAVGMGVSAVRDAAATYLRRVKYLGVPDDVAAQKAELAKTALRRAWRVLESPLEKTILPWLAFQDYTELMSHDPAAIFVGGKASSSVPVLIVPQYSVLNYRLDFAIVARKGEGSLTVAFECDGADYHNEWADKCRDAELREHGIVTLRASGKEIYGEAETAARPVAETIVRWAETCR
jgi:hypothetical protein